MTKFFLDQHGCAKNQVDGELIIARLTKKGLVQVFDASQADLIVVNSCGFIESAKKESLDAVISAKNAYPKAKLLLAGCLAERYADVFKTELPEADAILGNGDLSEIDGVIDAIEKNERPIVKKPQKGVCGGDRNMLLSFRGSAYIKITEGCNNNCTYCAIPLIRGELRSRKASEITDEIRSLLAKGIFEFNLVGQDLAAYGTGREDNVFGEGRSPLNCKDGKPSPLSRLLKEISAIEGDFWVRLLYIHPDHFTDDILPVIAADKRILPYFDIPFQTGDDKMIRAMNRTGSAESYVDIAKRIRAVLPEAALRTTFLTGFAGETKEAQENTERFIRELNFDWSGCFPYSVEEDTPGALMKNQVPHKTAELRAKRLEEIQAQITKERLSRRTGKEYDVLVEEIVEGDEGLAIARAWFQAPEVDGSVVISYDRDNPEENQIVQSGRLVRVRITSSGAVDLNGEFVSDSPLNANRAKSTLEFAEERINENARGESLATSQNQQ